MDSRIKKIFSSASNFKYKKQAVIIFGLIGVVLILLSELVPSTADGKSKTNTSTDYESYVSSLESRTQNIISSIDGVGKCRVMITLEQTDESVFAKNTDESSQNGNFSKKSEYVLYENANNDEPILVKQYFPKVYGVVIVCQGGDDTAVRERVISSVSALYDIPYSKISVSKLNG